MRKRNTTRHKAKSLLKQAHSHPLHNRKFNVSIRNVFTYEGLTEGEVLGIKEGAWVGRNDGNWLGKFDGTWLGGNEGNWLGSSLGNTDGGELGPSLGL